MIFFKQKSPVEILAMTKIPCLFVAFLFTCFSLLSSYPAISHAAASQESAAIVVAVRGDVQAINANGESRKLSVKSEVYEEDTIKSGKRGRLQILFTDNTIYSLGRNSELFIKEYNWQPEQKKGALKTEVKEGVFRVMGGAITKNSPKNFTTETPAATIGIRGSMYAGTVSPSSLAVVFHGGRGIDVTNSHGTVGITRAGHGTHVALNSAPEPPSRFNERDIDAMNQEIAPTEEETEEEPAEETDAETTEEQPADAGDEGENAEDASLGEWSEDMTDAVAADDTTSVTQVDTTVTANIRVDAIAGDNSPAGDAVSSEAVTTTTSPVGDISATPTPLANIPTDGLHIYKGTITGTSTQADGTVGTIDGEVHLEINWKSKKVVGRMVDPSGGPSQLFIGDVSGNEIINIKMLGSDAGHPTDPNDPGVVVANEGNGNGGFFGDNFGLLQFNGSGSSYEIEPASQPPFDNFSLTGAATIEPQMPGDDVSPTGSRTFKGFIVGLSENMGNIDTERRLFMNEDMNKFTINFNRDTGTLSGTLTVDDKVSNDADLTNISFGGGAGSAFTLEDNFAAFIDDTQGTVYANAMQTTGLKKHGNFIYSAHIDSEIADYVTWGYWEVAYTDPYSGEQYHLHVPGSRWVAGEPTPTTTVAALNFTATYHGNVLASKVNTNVSPQVSEHKGTIDLSVDFANINSASAVMGQINIAGVTLDVNSGSAGKASTSGFSNTTSDSVSQSGQTTISSSFNGGWFGPNANSTGGNFYVNFDSGVSYLGIFAGDR